MSLRKSSAAVMTALALFLTAGVAVAQNDALPTVLQKAAARWKVDPQNVTISLVSLENAGVLGADGLSQARQQRLLCKKPCPGSSVKTDCLSI